MLQNWFAANLFLKKIEKVVLILFFKSIFKEPYWKFNFDCFLRIKATTMKWFSCIHLSWNALLKTVNWSTELWVFLVYSLSSPRGLWMAARKLGYHNTLQKIKVHLHVLTTWLHHRVPLVQYLKWHFKSLSFNPSSNVP